MVASSSSSTPLVPPLHLSSFTEKQSFFEKLSARNTLASSERARGRDKSKGKVLSRSESFEPLPLPSLHDNRSPQRSLSLMPSFFLSESSNRINERNEIKRVSNVLKKFLKSADHRVCNEDAVLVLCSGLGEPSWRDLNRYPERRDHYMERSEKALWKLVGSIQIFVDINKFTFIRKKRVDGQIIAEDIPLTHLVDRFLKCNQMREIINRNELLRHKISNCYLKIMVNQLYEDCCAISQTLNEFEKFSLFNGLELLRRFVTTRHLRSNPLMVIGSPLEFYGYDMLFNDASIKEREEYTTQLMVNPSLLLTYDGYQIESVVYVLKQCQTQTLRAIDSIQAEKEKVQAPISRGEDLGIRLSNSLVLRTVGISTINFEKGFRGFIETNILFLNRHFKSDLEEFQVDIDRYYNKLNTGLNKPYDWRALRSLLNLLNFLVSKLMAKHNVPKTPTRKTSFIGTPRSFLSL